MIYMVMCGFLQQWGITMDNPKMAGRLFLKQNSFDLNLTEPNHKDEPPSPGMAPGGSYSDIPRAFIQLPLVKSLD